jgi:hypothetical protein
MSASRDPDQILLAWLEEGPTALPAPTVRAIEVASRATPQRRRALRLPWRFSPMFAPLRAALAVLIAAVLIGGGIYLLRLPESGPGATVTPSPSTAASPVPLMEGPLAQGRYAYDGQGVRVIMTLPEGWEGIGASGIGKAPFELPDGVNVGFQQPAAVFTDPCAPETSRESVGPAVDDLVNALSDLPNVTGSTQAEAAISGFSGTHLTFVVDTEGIDCVMALYGQGSFVRAAENGQHQDLWILDVDGTRLVIDAATFPQTSAADRAELQTIVETLVIEPIN